MNLMLEILDGERAGERIRLRNGLTLGRKDCDVNLRDSKVSSKHAAVELRSDGSFWLVDQESSNGIKIRDGKVKELLLESGLRFGIGRVTFQVVGIQDLFESTQPEILIDQEPVKQWTDILSELLSRAERSAKTKPDKEFAVFWKPVRLTVQRGIQAGEEWTLAYGPREVGGNSVDLPLFESGLPPKCFSLAPDRKGIVLTVADAARDRVRINGKIVIGEMPVGSGDVIEIGETRIEVTLIEDAAHAR